MRECGGCSVCCYIGSVPELKKPPHRECKYQGEGCSIYGQSIRPKVCNDFQCSWIRGFGEGEDRPDKSKVMVTINNIPDGNWIFVIELEKDALVKGGERIVTSVVNQVDVPAIIVNYDSYPPDDRGDRTVIKNSLVDKTKRMRGEFIEWLSNGIGIYDLMLP